MNRPSHGGATTTFAAVNGISAGANTTGSCSPNFAGIKRRTTTATSTVVTTGGVAARCQCWVRPTFLQDIGACVAQTNTVVTRFTVVQEQTLTANAASTYGAVTPAGISGTPGGTQTNGTCGSNRAQIWRRTTTYDQTVVTVGGTVNPATYGANSYAFAPVGGCVNLTSTTTTPVTDTIQWVGGETSPPNDPDLVSRGRQRCQQPDYLHLHSNFRCCHPGLDVQTAADHGYNRIVTTVGARAGLSRLLAATPAARRSRLYRRAALAAKTATNSSVNGATSGPVVTGHPVAAGSTTNSAVLSNTTTGGPTPAASTSTPGATTSTSTGATITAIGLHYRSSNPGGDTVAGPIAVTVNTSTQGPLGYADTLADVAQYYYINDLRAPGSLGAAVSGVQLDVGTDNNVPGQPGTDPQNDSAGWQHMTTFTLGLGVDGTLTYAPDYRTNPTGDFLAIRTQRRTGRNRLRIRRPPWTICGTQQ